MEQIFEKNDHGTNFIKKLLWNKFSKIVTMEQISERK